MRHVILSEKVIGYKTCRWWWWFRNEKYTNIHCLAVIMSCRSHSLHRYKMIDNNHATNKMYSISIA